MWQTRSTHAALRAEELVRLTKELVAMGARKILLLFGSYARGRNDLLADFDLMVIMESDLPFVERLGMLYRHLAPRVAVDLLVYIPGRMAKNTGNSVRQARPKRREGSL